MNTVRTILNQRPGGNIYTVVPEQTVLSAAQYMKANNIGAVIVMRDGTLSGILSERDLLIKVTGPGVDPRDLSVSKIMSPSVTIVSPDESWDDCLVKMGTAHCRHLPVVDEGRLIGMISLRDILGVDEAKCLDNYLWDTTARQEEVVQKA